jgi:hypothetical protein
MWLLAVTLPLTAICVFSGCMLYAGLPTYCELESVSSLQTLICRLAIACFNTQSLEDPLQAQISNVVLDR